MRRQLRGSVVVVTGASSGIGRASALAFARQGAKVVVVGRAEQSLVHVVAACEALGATAVAVPADTAQLEDLERILRVALQRFGRVDTWVNAAAGLVVGPFGSEDLAAVDRILATNIRGTTLASRVCLAQFHEQGHGVLVNVASMLGVVVNPMAPIYVMTKFAVRGLSLSLHHATRGHPGIRVCVVLPSAVDTPMFQHAANSTGRALRAIPPATSPERVAAAILGCARRPRRQRPVGVIARAILLGLRLSPALTELFVARWSGSLLLRSSSAPASHGALDVPQGPGATSGGWRRGRVRRRLGDALGRAHAARLH